ncbi:MAG: hypothetical protein Q9226_002870 [Calogaya cf. arnoldii]
MIENPSGGDTTGTSLYVECLKPLYTDCTFENLAATANTLYGKQWRRSYTTDDVAYHVTKNNEELKYFAKEGLFKCEINLETESQFLWFKLLEYFTGDETNPDYNKPLQDIASYRIDYEKTMEKLGKPIPPDAAYFTQDRTADVERLSKPGPINIQDLVDLRPTDHLKLIYDARKKAQGRTSPTKYATAAGGSGRCVSAFQVFGSPDGAVEGFEVEHIYFIANVTTGGVTARLDVPASIMPSMKSFTDALKGKTRKSKTPEKSFATSSSAKNDDPKTDTPMYERLSEECLRYCNILKPLYTDITYEDLCATVNLLYMEDYTKVQVAYCMADAQGWLKKRVKEGQVAYDVGSIDLELESQFAWMKAKGFFIGDEMDFEYNEPLMIIDLHRTEYDKAMKELGRPAPPGSAYHTRDHRTVDVERLSKLGPIAIQDLIDLRPLELRIIHSARTRALGARMRARQPPVTESWDFLPTRWA